MLKKFLPIPKKRGLRIRKDLASSHLFSKTRINRIFKQIVKKKGERSLDAMPVIKRFLDQETVGYTQAVKAASDYVANISNGGREWLYRKPFDPSPGNLEYFSLMYALNNLLKAMNIREEGRVLEAGSGSGWLTEILLMLGFQVDALEPAADMLQIARNRCQHLGKHYQIDFSEQVYFHQTTIEESEFAEHSFDAIIFFDSLHHVVDEHTALEKVFSYLKPGGCLGIVEGAWHPGNKALERQLVKEMDTYGTLENLFH